MALEIINASNGVISYENFVFHDSLLGPLSKSRTLNTLVSLET